jgi:hypothetical protein
MFGVPSKFHNYRLQGRGKNFVEAGFTPINSSLVGLNKDAKMGPDAISNTAFSTVFSSVAVADVYRNYQHLWQPVEQSSDTWHGSAAPGNVRASTWTLCIDNTYVTWPATIRPVPKTLMQEKNKLNDQGIKKYRLQDYFLFLANVKNIPIGVAPKQSILINNNALVGELDAVTDTVASYDTNIAIWNLLNGSFINSNIYCCTPNIFRLDWCVGRKSISNYVNCSWIVLFTNSVC